MRTGTDKPAKTLSSDFRNHPDGVNVEDIFQSSPFGVIATDEDGIIIRANERAGEIIRVRTEYLTGTALSDWDVHTDNLSLLTGDNASCLREKEGRRLLVSRSPLYFSGGRAGAVYSLLDVSAFDGSDFSLSQPQCNLESLIESSHDGIILIDHEKIVMVNNSYLRISGLKKSKVEGMKISSLSNSLHV